MSGQYFLGLTNSKQGIMCFAQGHNTVMPMSFKPQPLDLSSEFSLKRVYKKIFFHFSAKIWCNFSNLCNFADFIFCTFLVTVSAEVYQLNLESIGKMHLLKNCIEG